jgi:chemotaxis protein MotB
VRRKVRHEEHENHERWLVSYADFITLLFAFFTVLYATAQTDQKKLDAVVNGMNAAFEGGMPQALLDVLAMQPEPPDLPEIVPNHLAQEAADPLIFTIKRNLAGSLSDHVVQMGLVDQELTLVLPERLLFAPGSAELHPSAFAVLSEIARLLATAPVTIEVIGHADGLPVVAGGRWDDNWDLAGARSLTTVRYLARHGIPVEALTASANITRLADAEARAVTLRVHVADPAPAAEIADQLAPATERPGTEHAPATERTPAPAAEPAPK